MLDIEQIIELFDEYIDNEPIEILGKEYVTSDLLRNCDHNFYCKQLDKFILDRFERIDDDWYKIRSE